MARPAPGVIRARRVRRTSRISARGSIEVMPLRTTSTSGITDDKQQLKPTPGLPTQPIWTANPTLPRGGVRLTGQASGTCGEEVFTSAVYSNQFSCAGTRHLLCPGEKFSR